MREGVEGGRERTIARHRPTHARIGFVADGSRAATTLAAHARARLVSDGTRAETASGARTAMAATKARCYETNARTHAHTRTHTPTPTHTHTHTHRSWSPSRTMVLPRSVMNMTCRMPKYKHIS